VQETGISKLAEVVKLLKTFSVQDEILQNFFM